MRFPGKRNTHPTQCCLCLTKLTRNSLPEWTDPPKKGICSKPKKWPQSETELSEPKDAELKLQAAIASREALQLGNLGRGLQFHSILEAKIGPSLKRAQQKLAPYLDFNPNPWQRLNWPEPYLNFNPSFFGAPCFGIGFLRGGDFDSCPHGMIWGRRVWLKLVHVD